MSTPIRIGSKFLVNTTTNDSQSEPSVAGLSDGGFVMAWQDYSRSAGDTSGWAVRAQKFAEDGSRSGGEGLVNNTTLGDQWHPSVAARSIGGYVVVWEDGSQAVGDASGQAVVMQTILVDGEISGQHLVNTTTAGNQETPRIANLSDGGTAIVWEDGSQTGDDTSGQAVRGRVYGPTGMEYGTDFVINTTTADDQKRPKIAALTGGGFVVIWEDNSQTGGDTSDCAVRGQVFTADGSRTGGEFLVNTTTNGDQGEPSVAALSDGGFVVSWEDWSATGGDTSSGAVRGQRFAADGNRSGGEFLVNTITQGRQSRPSVAGLTDGGFVVAWESRAADSVPGSLYGQAFDAGGSKSGSDFLIDYTATHGEINAEVAGLGNGGFVVAWNDFLYSGSDASGRSVQAQIYHSTTLAIAADAADKVEGSGGGTPFTFTVTRAGDTSGASSVDYTVTGSGGNAAAATDFQGGAFPTGTVSFTAGETSKPVTIMVAADTAVEADEGFTVTLSNPANAGIVTASATGNIQNDDQPAAPNSGGGDGGQDQTTMVPASGVVNALLGLLSARNTDPTERAFLAGSIAGYTPPAGAAMIDVHVVVPATGGAAPGTPIVISGGGSGQEALVVDARQLPANAMLRLDSVGYAVLLGDATVQTNDRSQALAMDGGRQSVALGAGNDTLHGGGGDDVVASGAGSDLLFGNAGADLFYGGKGDDELHGGKGDDVLFGDLGTDMVFGELGADSLQGGAGDDLVNGGLDSDTVHGGQDNDTVRGGKGNDLVFGDLGDDALWGDLGDDTLSGGAGADTFWIRTGDGHDVITDFNAAEGDRIGLADGLSYTTRTNAAGDAVIVFSDGNDLTLQGVGLGTSGTIPASWFVRG